MARRKAPTKAQPALPGLALHANAERAEALLKERARLLRDVNKKKQQVVQARAAAEREAQATASKMAPLLARHDALAGELTALFDELLAVGRLAAKARKQVLRARAALELQGILPPLADESADGTYGEPEGEVHFPWDEDVAGDPQARSAPGGSSRSRGGSSRRPHRPADSAPELASARQPGQERRSLRELFRSLVSAIHPDRARQEPDREHRTEVMKELTRAYAAGDLARLIELESAWQSERVLAGDGDPELRCRELERVNRELLDQVRQLTRELRDVKQQAREASFGPLEALLEQAEQELDELAALRDFVRKFRDGKISLSEFTRGPPSFRDADEDIAFAIESLFFDELDTAQHPGPRRARSKAR